MKNKTLLLASVFSLALASIAQADTTNYVYVTGSTAARGTFQGAMAGTAVFPAGPASAVYQGNATFSKCSYMTFVGHLSTDSSSTWTCVKCSWSGSEGGISDLANGTAEKFLSDGAVNNVNVDANLVSHTVDLAMADNAVNYSKNPNAAVSGTKVCVITFKWIKEKGSLSTISNVTDAQLRALLGGGTPASLLTGNASDSTWVYMTGRDSDSGTRVNALGNTSYGIFNAPDQIEVSATGAMLNCTNTTTGAIGYLGDFGYSSGGSVASQMGYDLSSSSDLLNGGGHFSVVAYLGYGDATSAISNGGIELAYNGVMFSPDAVKNGTYAFWGNEYLYRNSSAAGAPLGVYNGLVANLGSYVDGTSTISLASMNASRQSPVQDPVHN